RNVLQRMDRALETPPYNLVLHTSPFSEDATDVYHWHLEVMPKLTRVAGVEWGTGFYINPTSPEEAARVLRNVQLSRRLLQRTRRLRLHRARGLRCYAL